MDTSKNLPGSDWRCNVERFDSDSFHFLDVVDDPWLTGME